MCQHMTYTKDCSYDHAHMSCSPGNMG